MKLKDFVCFDAVVAELKSTDRDEVIAELIQSLDKAGKLGKAEPDKIIRAVIKRENEASTGMGKGVAVPHVKYSDFNEVVAAVGRSAKGIEFDSLDKKPVYSVILLISPADESEQHLQAMENVFKHLQQEKFRKFLRQSQSVEEIVDLLKEADENPSL